MKLKRISLIALVFNCFFLNASQKRRALPEEKIRILGIIEKRFHKRFTGEGLTGNFGNLFNHVDTLDVIIKKRNKFDTFYTVTIRGPIGIMDVSHITQEEIDASLNP